VDSITATNGVTQPERQKKYRRSRSEYSEQGSAWLSSTTRANLLPLSTSAGSATSNAEHGLDRKDGLCDPWPVRINNDEGQVAGWPQISTKPVSTLSISYLSEPNREPSGDEQWASNVLGHIDDNKRIKAH